jgi:hypothetical protein
VNVISSIEGDDHQARGRSRKEANCDRIRCVLGCSGPSIFSNSSGARLRPPDENLAQPNLVLGELDAYGRPISAYMLGGSGKKLESES